MSVFAILLSHREGTKSPRSIATMSTLNTAGTPLGELEYFAAYIIEADVDTVAQKTMTDLLADPVLEDASIVSGELSAGEGGTTLSVLRKPGVMDPVEASVLASFNNAGLSADAVKCVHVYHFQRELNEDECAAAAKSLGNEAIEDVHFGTWSLSKLSMSGRYTFELVTVPVRELDESGLKALNKERGLSMNIAELLEVQKFFVQQEREPTDVELEMLAQTWSEHCKHKTLTGPVRYEEVQRDDAEIDDSLFDLPGDVVPADGLISGLLQTTIKRATDELDKDYCWSVFVDNAGVIDMDGEDGICVKVETHNHPSAIEPYGGAGTGIGGVIRDILGTGLGAKPIANTDVFCFGPLDLGREDVPRGALHPKQTMRGVVSGVRDYGNRMGIPTVNGAICFDERYTGNPLVYAGSIGVIPKHYVEKAAKPGDKIVAVGGRTGRDGIGGATFSSVELTEDSETVSSGAVQIGNAIQEKVVLDAMLQARDQNLYNAVTDCGAGGFSSAVGEMGEETGAHVELTGSPLKYQGLSYREIWLSEAQERMVFAVPANKLEAFLAVFEAEDVETAVLGEFSDDRRMIVNYDGNTVLDMPMAFLHDGLPKVERNASWTPPASHSKPGVRAQVDAADHGAVLKAILSSPNVCSKEWVVRQYDHEVQGMSALKPFTGVNRDGPSNASAVVPKPSSGKAVLVGCGLNPHYGDLDPYWMAQGAIDEAIRNVVASGGNPDHSAILDNFSWGNCDNPEQMGAMVRACAGCYVASKGFGAPFISGKDSRNNEFATEAGTVAIPATLLVTAVSVTELETITSMDLKRAGNTLYMLGETKAEMGASHYSLVTGEHFNEVPKVNPAQALKQYRALYAAIQSGLIRSAHDCSEGGLAVTLAEMSFAGGLGASVELTPKLTASAEDVDDDVLLFSESHSRIVVEIPSDKIAEAEVHFDGLPFVRLGNVSDDDQLSITGTTGAMLIQADVNELRDTWKLPLYAAMGDTALA